MSGIERDIGGEVKLNAIHPPDLEIAETTERRRKLLEWAGH